MINVISAVFRGAQSTTTRNAYQYDYGQVLKTNLALPETYEVQFSNNSSGGVAITQIGNADGVTIPDQMFISGAPIYAWIFLHQGADDGETVYFITIPVTKRAKPTSKQPTPVQKDAITQAIAALNSAVEQTGQDVEDANNAAESARESADAFEGMIAEEYDENKTYTIGDYSIHNDVLYRCITAITTAEAWTAAHWTEAVLGDDIGDLKSALSAVEDVLEIEENFTVTATVYGTTIIAPDVTFVAGDTLRWSIPAALAVPIYCYVYNNADERITSRSLNAGETEVSIVIHEGATNGYITCISNSVSVDVTFTIIPQTPSDNRLDQIEDDIASLEDAVDNVYNGDIIPGYDLKSANGVETGAGAYYWQSGAPYLNTSGSYGTDYTWFIFPIKKNSVYSTSVAPRWIILVDETGAIVSDSVTGKMIQTGNAVKMYFTIYTVYLNSFAISEGYLANQAIRKALTIDQLPTNNHGNSLPVDTIYFTIGIPETIYYNNVLALDGDRLECVTSCNGQDSHDADGITITPLTTFSNSDNAVRQLQYDSELNLIYKPVWSGLVIKALNLQDCSVLVIGDSTVGSWGLMTERMLNVFDDNNKTLTLLGTQHSGETDARNYHEGRGGWSAKTYCTEATHGYYSNPFLNDGHFDFSYYMTQQGYTAPDFVIIQLGINDVSGIGMDEFESVSALALGYEKEIIDSIRAYNTNIKILINPPTTPTTDQSKLSMYYETTIFRNLVIRYAMMLRRLVAQYNSNNVRCSNNNLILNSATDIRDNVHPTDGGFDKLGDEMINQINCWQN